MSKIELQTAQNLFEGSNVTSNFAAERTSHTQNGSPHSQRIATVERDSSSELSYLSVLPPRRVSLSQRVPAPHHVSHGDISTRHSNNMLIAFDERHAPLYVTTFSGRLDLEAVVWHDTIATKAINEALDVGRRVVHIVDARQVEVPNAQLRRHWATRIQQSVGTLETMLGNFVVIDSPILRGALTAIDWLCHEGRRIEYFSTLADAVAVANLRLAAAGHAPSALDAANYRVVAGSLHAARSSAGASA